jgi:tetratricopeptide (TPR) repeat protein
MEAQKLGPNPATTVQLAKAQLAAGQPSEQIITSLDALPKEYRTAREIRHLIAQAYASSGRYMDALREMAELRAAGPEQASDLLMEAKLRQKVGDPASALPLLKRAGQLDATSPEIPFTAAFSYFVLDRNEEAADALTDAINKDPAFGRAYFLRAILELSTGRPAEGSIAVKKALALDPENVHYRCVYGMGLLSDGHSQEAIAEFRRVIKAKPKYALAHYQLGRALAAERKFNDAVPELEQAIRLDPEISEAYYHLARAYQRAGRQQEATQMFEKVRVRNAKAATERQELLRAMQQDTDDKSQTK